VVNLDPEVRASGRVHNADTIQIPLCWTKPPLQDSPLTVLKLDFFFDGNRQQDE